MKIIGLTGGIGSGKTTISNWFLEKGIPVYNSDIEAKKLMNSNLEVIEKLIDLFGEEVYTNGKLNRSLIASQVFQHKNLLEKLNKIVHPAVFKDFQKWIKSQEAEMLVKEAAILFESGSYRDCDFIISVVADENIRIKRVMNRDGVTEAQVRSRMDNQWTDKQRIEHSDYIVNNNKGLEELKYQFDEVYKKLLKQVSSR